MTFISVALRKHPPWSAPLPAPERVGEVGTFGAEGWDRQVGHVGATTRIQGFLLSIPASEPSFLFASSISYKFCLLIS